MQIKSGTNNFRGSAFELLHERAAADAELLRAARHAEGDWRYNQYGGTLGGPIVRNKLFFFASYEGTRDQQTLNRTVSVPTAALRRGDLSASPTPIYDPFTGNPNGSGRTAVRGNNISRRAHRSDGATAARAPAAAQPAPPRRRNEQLLRAGAVRAEPLDARHEGELERHRKLNLFGRFSVLDFFTENGTNFGKELQGSRSAAATPAPEGEHLQRLGRRDLH